MDLECWVKKWRLFDGGRRRKSWKWKLRTVVNSECRGYGMKLLRWPTMGGLRMGDDEGEDLVDGKEWSEKRWWEDWRRTRLDFMKGNWLLKNKCEFRTRWIVKCENFRIPVIFHDQDHGFGKMLTKAISHKVCITMHFRTEIFGGDREHAFWKMLTKAISHKGVGWCEFSTRELGGANFAGSWLFLPCFPLFSPRLHSSSFPTCMLTQKPIQTTLEWN